MEDYKFSFLVPSGQNLPITPFDDVTRPGFAQPQPKSNQRLGFSPDTDQGTEQHYAAHSANAGEYLLRQLEAQHYQKQTWTLYVKGQNIHTSRHKV